MKSELIKSEEIKNILIINLGGIGDFLLSTPALKALRKYFLEARISILIVPRVFELVKDMPFIDEVFVLYVDGWAYKIFNNLNTLSTLKKKRFDLAINMRTLVSRMSAMKISFLLDIINPKVKAGRDTEGRGDFLDIKIDETARGEKYEMDYDIDTVKALGVEVIDRSIDFKIDDKGYQKIKQTLENEYIATDNILIGIHLGGRPSHRWPIGNFLQTIKKINEKLKCRFIITGDQEQSSLINILIRETDIRIINLTGKLNINELGALIKMCDVYISNDTAPMHIAAILKTPLVAIFGAGYIIRFDPRNISERVIILHKEADCAPCDKVACDSLKCLKEILPQEVVAAALNLLNKYHKNA